MTIEVYSRQDIERGAILKFQEQHPGARVAIISITDPDAKPVSLIYKQNEDVRVIRVPCHDVNPEIEDRTFGHYVAMTPVQAEQIVEFWNKNTSVELLAVQCEAGISRSSAVAAACAKLAGWPNEEFLRHPFVPNMYCYDLVVAAGSKVEDVKL